MAEYGYKTNRPQPTLKAQQVGEELERIRQQCGELTPTIVVDQSRAPTAVLHQELDLHISDRERAERWSQHKARNVINVVTVVPQVPGSPSQGPAVQAFVNIVEGPAHQPDSRNYQPINEILADDRQRALLVHRCLEKLLRVQREFRHLRELQSLWSHIDDLALELA